MSDMNTHDVNDMNLSTTSSSHQARLSITTMGMKLLKSIWKDQLPPVYLASQAGEPIKGPWGCYRISILPIPLSCYILERSSQTRVTPGNVACLVVLVKLFRLFHDRQVRL